MIHRQILGALACSDHLEPRRARPIHHFTNQCRLVAVSERVNDARLTRTLREQRAGQSVGLDVHHHDVFAVLATSEHVVDARSGAAGGVDDDFNGIAGNSLGRIIGDERGAVLTGIVQ